MLLRYGFMSVEEKELIPSIDQFAVILLRDKYAVSFHCHRETLLIQFSFLCWDRQVVFWRSPFQPVGLQLCAAVWGYMSLLQ